MAQVKTLLILTVAIALVATTLGESHKSSYGSSPSVVEAPKVPATKEVATPEIGGTKDLGKQSEGSKIQSGPDVKSSGQSGTESLSKPLGGIVSPGLTGAGSQGEKKSGGHESGHSGHSGESHGHGSKSSSYGR